MSLKKHRKNLHSLFVIFAALTAIIWSGAPSSAINAQTPRRVPFDFTGDGRTDWATIAIPTTAGQSMTWKVAGNPAPAGPNAAFIRRFDYGISGDEVVAADYTGDRKTDPTVWRAGTPGIFYEAQFPTGPQGIMLDQVIRWGASNDNAREGGDYDGDGKADYTVVRQNSDGSLTWFIQMSATGTQRVVNFGNIANTYAAQILPGADFTGDGRDELVLVTADATTHNITYYIGDAVTGLDVITRQFGNYDDDYQVAPADYTGDGKADLVAVRQTLGSQANNQEIWFIYNPVTNTTTATPFGVADPGFATAGDLPVRGDYDGDGKADIAVWRPSNQTFYYLRSSSNNTVVDGQKFGDAGDIPLGTLATF